MSNKQQEYIIFIVLTIICTFIIYLAKIIPTPIVLSLGGLIIVWLLKLIFIDEIKFRAFAKNFWG